MTTLGRLAARAWIWHWRASVWLLDKIPGFSAEFARLYREMAAGRKTVGKVVKCCGSSWRCRCTPRCTCRCEGCHGPDRKSVIDHLS